MPPYAHNKRCSCQRCRTHGLIGPAILITIGVLFLLHENNWVYFHQSWPVILLVIGAGLIGSRSAPADGHVPPGWAMPAAAPQSPQSGWNSTTATPQESAGTPPVPSAPVQNDQQVKP